MTNHEKSRSINLILLLGALVLCSHVNGQKRPPNYSEDDMPITSFSCRDKIVGGYYADPETDCQMFHVCVRVPGVGVQNFRFLCPNDTSFDQEHQICDDWYNIDCELSSLYYSDSFDLYRIGANNEVKKPSISHKGTPIPLGPSSTIKPWQGDKPKKNQFDDEDDYKRNGNDILRGSHSSNFYASSNRGREDLDDNDYETPNVGTKRQELNQSTDLKKQKTFVRKLASKRPVAHRPIQQPYQQNVLSSTASTASTTRQQSNQQFNQIAYANKIPKSRGNINFNSYTSKIVQPEYERAQFTTTNTPTLFQRINNLTETEVQNSEELATLTYDINKTYDNTFNFRQQTNAFNKQKITAPKATYSDLLPIVQTQTESIRLPSTEYLRTIAQTYQQPAALINNQLQDASNNHNRQFSSSQYEQYKKTQNSVTKPSSFVNYDNDYHQHSNTYQKPITVNSYQTTAKAPVTQNKYYDHSLTLNKKTQSADIYSHQSHTTPGIQFPLNATSFDYHKYYQTSTVDSHGNSISHNRNNYYSTSPVYNFYQSSTSGDVVKTYDPHVKFQKVDDKYDDEEFLKTAPSSNLKPSDLNAIHNQKKHLYINATLRAAYSVDESAKPSYKQQSVATSSAKPIVTSPAKPLTSTSLITRTPQKTSYQQNKEQTTYTSPNTGISNSTKNQDYDYAYYDNGGGSFEYDQLDAVEEDFARIQKIHGSKS